MTSKDRENEFLVLFAGNPRKRCALDKAVARLAAWGVEDCRKMWDEITPAAQTCRAWFLSRDKGLRAFADYEAAILLGHFSQDGFITADRYIEATLHEQIRKSGYHALSKWRPGFFDWEDFLKYKRLHDPLFFLRLGQWLYKGNALKYFATDLRIKFYAAQYDRAPVPLEFCSDGFAAGWINSVIHRQANLVSRASRVQINDWPGPKKETNPDAVKGWRRLLRLSLTPQPVYRSADAAGTPRMANLAAARSHGLPFNPESGLPWGKEEARGSKKYR